MGEEEQKLMWPVRRPDSDAGTVECSGEEFESDLTGAKAAATTR